MLLYIAGPMTGLLDYNYPAFREANRSLLDAGYEVLNPARHGADHPGWTYTDYLRLGLQDVIKCDGIAVLPDPICSAGARLEVHVAKSLGMEIKTVAEWISLAETSSP